MSNGVLRYVHICLPDPGRGAMTAPTDPLAQLLAGLDTRRRYKVKSAALAEVGLEPCPWCDADLAVSHDLLGWRVTTQHDDDCAWWSAYRLGGVS